MQVVDCVPVLDKLGITRPWEPAEVVMQQVISISLFLQVLRDACLNRDKRNYFWFYLKALMRK